MQVEDISLGIFVPEGYTDGNIDIRPDHKIQFDRDINDIKDTNMLILNVSGIDLDPVTLVLYQVRIPLCQGFRHGDLFFERTLRLDVCHQGRLIGYVFPSVLHHILKLTHDVRNIIGDLLFLFELCVRISAGCE